ncbi:uncharacterized protein LOC135091989 isoform X2 [Scylla paramamosain]|uniref:uncharacterized protein LOC135091989 isoform X2 n=1 Tax=Scylla paramamosain TaxID=85552 RepID=UPI003083BCFE
MGSQLSPALISLPVLSLAFSLASPSPLPLPRLTPRHLKTDRQTDKMAGLLLRTVLVYTLTICCGASLHNTDEGYVPTEDTDTRPKPIELPWSPSLEREMARSAGTEGSLENVQPLESDHWRSIDTLGHPEEEEMPLVPIEIELSQRTRAQLDTLSRSAHLAQPRFGLETPLDPLSSSSSLKYVHEGDLLKLRLVLDNLTLAGLSSLSVQEVTFQRGPAEEEVSRHDLAEGGGRHGRRNGRRAASSSGLVRAAFSQVVVRAKYQVRGSAGGFLTFRESGNLTLTAPTVFLTSRLALILPPPPPLSPLRSAATPHRRHGGRVKVVRVRSEVTTGPTTLTIQPAAHPPKWVRQQVQTKLEELSKDLSRGHGAVRRLLHLWGKLLKRLIHRTARAIA